MAETIIVSSINRNTEYPVYQDITAKYCCGTVKIIIDDTYTEQMLAELPNITINIYTESDGEKVLYTSRALSMAIPNDSNPIESVLIDIPTSCILALIPEFDNNAIISHNSAVCTNNEGTMWTDITTEFPIQIIWDDTNVYAEQSGGGGGEASNVSYDNTTSGITATNVQDAIDIVAEAISELEGGVHYIGEVDYYNDLPANPNLGDGYTVKYSGTSGTNLDGTEYVWAKKNGTPQWIDFSKDTYTKTETNNLLNNKQDKITAGTGLAFGTGVNINTLNHSNSTTAKTTQAIYKTSFDAQGHITGSTDLTTAESDAISSGINSTKVSQITTNAENITTLQQQMGDVNTILEAVL